MEAKEVREFSTKELKEKELSLSQELFNLKFQKYTGQLDKPSQINVIRKDLARVKTILREKEKQG